MIAIDPIPHPDASGRPFRVALAQLAPRLGDVQANLELHLERMAEARGAGAELVVFPELSLTGYFLRDHVAEVAEPVGGPSLGRIAAASAELGIDVVVGFVEEDRSHRFFNCSAYVDRGRLAHVHRKVYLPTYGMFDEGRYFAAGDRVRAFETRFGRVGLLVCEDAWHLSCGVVLQAEGIDLLIIPANSPARGVREPTLGSQQTWTDVVRTFATFLNVPTAFANRVGFEDGVAFFGGSRLVAASGAVLAEGPVLEEATVVGRVDPRDTRLQRILAPLGRDERPEVTLAELERIRDEGRRRGT